MDKKVKEYLDAQKTSQKQICLELRKIILATYPGIKEEMRWGAIVYDEGKFYIGVVRYGVNLGFLIKDIQDSDLKLFKGAGKTMRHIKIIKKDDIDKKEIVKRLKLVKK